MRYSKKCNVIICDEQRSCLKLSAGFYTKYQYSFVILCFDVIHFLLFFPLAKLNWCFCCYSVCKLPQSYYHTAFRQGCTRFHTCKSYIENNNIYFVPNFLWWAKLIRSLHLQLRTLSRFSATFCIVQWSVTNMKLVIRGQKSTLSFRLFIAMVITRNLPSSCLNCCPFHVGNREPLSSFCMNVIDIFTCFSPLAIIIDDLVHLLLQTVSCQSKCY